MTAKPERPDRILASLGTLAEMLELSEDTIEREVIDGLLPEPLIIRHRRRWIIKDVERALAKRAKSVAVCVDDGDAIEQATRRKAAGGWK